jgi:hypothetical protein
VLIERWRRHYNAISRVPRSASDQPNSHRTKIKEGTESKKAVWRGFVA